MTSEALIALPESQAAIYTEHVKPAHVVCRVMLRMTAIINYVKYHL